MLVDNLSNGHFISVSNPHAGGIQTKRQLKNFDEGVDYIRLVLVDERGNTGLAGTRGDKIDYILTLDTAKHIAL